MPPALRSAPGRLARATHGRSGWLVYTAAVLAIAAVILNTTYRAVGQPELLGIDDADITQVYARHIADGGGYVFTPGSERVEGATSPLWVLINAAAFLVARHAEAVILAAGCVLTLAPMILIGRIADWLAPAAREAASQRITVLIWFACLPGYFTWLALTLMDQALWASVVALLLAILSANLLSKLKPMPFRLLASLAAILAVLTRPEAMAQVPLMLVTAGLAAWRVGGWTHARAYVAPFIATAASLAALTLWRVCYFGYPLPNTFYAKVSSNERDNLASGYDYVTRFLRGDALYATASLCVVAATALAAWRLLRAASSGTADRGMGRHAAAAVAGATVIEAIGLQVAIGGDHFGSFRMLQPILPVCAIPLAYLAAEIRAFIPPRVVPNRAAALVLVPVTMIGLPWRELHLYVQNNNIGQEFYIGNIGRQMGTILNGLAPERSWSVGVAAAGGIALTYRGPVLDLLGLNWAAMAHATGRRAGMRGHSAFSDAVFWDHPPDLALPMWVAGGNFDSVLPYLQFYQSVFHRLLSAPRFQDSYAPVLYATTSGTVLVFCRLELLPRLAGPGVMRIVWSRIPAR